MTTGPKVMVSIAATFVVSAVVVALTSLVVASRSAPPGQTIAVSRQTLLWSPGACVSRTGPRYDLTPCNGGVAEVLTVTDGPCPPDSDDVLRVGGSRTACVRNFLDPHPGEPGGGGGVIRPGDCVALDGGERPCASTGWYGRAVAVVRRASTCPRGTLDTLTLVDHQVACLGGGGHVLARGACVARPPRTSLTRSAITQVTCSSPRAWAQVTSVESSAKQCPEGSNRYLEAPGAYRPVTCLHLVSK
ncbi:hypothetical protein ACIBHX_21780 [Nonomuraea sp. NPDC050536]|uniref:hypothetical protein n=1 Tax=Nonomuraea sp. NPDC050536 TaxID=3364366 RepID=UPI0037CBB3FD